MATRCCWPPDSCDGQRVELVGQPDRLQHRLRPADRLTAGGPRRSAAARRRSRPPSAPAAGCTAGTRSRCACRGSAPAAVPAACAGPGPGRVSSPSVGSSSPAMMEISVVLPQPDWPTSSVIWPAVHVHVHAAQGQHLGVAVAELLGHAAADDGPLQGVHRTQRGLCRWLVLRAHRFHPRNTTAGSRNSTLRMLTRLDSTTMRPPPPPCRPAPARA